MSDEKRETYREIPPDQILGWAVKQNFTQLLVMGIDEWGKFRMASTRGTRAEIQQLLNELEVYLKGGNQ